jgi:hypothetical protein
LPKLDLSIKTHTGEPIAASQVRLFPVSQAVTLQVSGRGGVVWNRPVSVGVQKKDEEVHFIPVYDYTRLVQVSILAAGIIGSFLIWFFLRKK